MIRELLLSEMAKYDHIREMLFDHSDHNDHTVCLVISKTQRSAEGLIKLT